MTAALRSATCPPGLEPFSARWRLATFQPLTLSGVRPSRQAPERIQALLLADTFATLDSAERREWRFTTADRLEREGMTTYAQEELPKMITPANAQRLPEVAAHVMQMMTSTPPRGAAAALRGRAQRQDYLPLLSKIQIATLVVVGREDVYTPVRVAGQLTQQIPSAKLVVIENAGHMPNLEQPGAFNEAVGSWLRRYASVGLIDSL